MADEQTRDPRGPHKTAGSMAGTTAGAAGLIAAFAPDIEATTAVAITGVLNAVVLAIGSVARDYEHNNGMPLKRWQRLLVKLFSSLFG